MCCLFLFFINFCFTLIEHKPSGYWKDTLNCRKYFDGLAKENGFDPLKEENWYSYTFPKDLTLHTYPGGVKAALQRAYPELTFTQWQERKYSPFFIFISFNFILFRVILFIFINNYYLFIYFYLFVFISFFFFLFSRIRTERKMGGS